MASQLYQQIELISREKHIEPEIIVAAIEDAMVVAARKFYRTEEDLRSKFNPDTGQVDVFSVHIVVEDVVDPIREISLNDARKRMPEIEIGGEITQGKPTDVLGRIAAQTAKQVILQKVREAERDTIYNEFHTRVGELINSVVKRMEGPGHHRGYGTHRSASAQTRTVKTRSLQRGRPAPGNDSRRGARGERATGGGFPCRPRPGAAFVRNGSSGNLRRHGADSRRSA